ncbi:MAG TPA: hypothetical protein VER79_03895 [Candidatus Limnocylindrales bacterium]|nr:hypothetical protein [Candidatus Limnocylindrales bacterium]
MREIIMMVFPTRGSMVDATDKLHHISGLHIHQSALIVRAEHGEVTIFEDDISPTEGAITGGTLGGLIGALGVAGLGAFLLPGVGPIIAIGAGALAGGLIGGTTGGVTARVIDHGLNNHLLEELARQLADNQIAAVMDVEGGEEQLQEATADIARFNGRLVVVKPPADTPAASNDPGPVPPAPMP